jgi:glycosyltransferase involved in cell wall biosynthesis
MVMPKIDGLRRYAVVSFDSRRDLEDPMRFFRRLDVVHLCRGAPWNDMIADDVRSSTRRYTNPGNLYLTLRKLNPDLVQAVEPFALVTVPYTIAVLAYVLIAKKPLVAVSLENLPIERKYGGLVGHLLRAIVRPVIKRAALVIYINDGAGQNFLAAGAAPHRMVRLMYGCWGVDLDEFSPSTAARSLRRQPDEQVILFVGRVHEMKGVFDLLEAFRRMRQFSPGPVRLVFAGQGAAVELMRRWIRDAGLDGCVDLLGSVKNRDIPGLMRAADVLAAPSRTTRLWAEQVGMVLLQAMACGLPVVATRSGSIPEFVDDGTSGLLVPERDPAALAAALSRVLSDEDLRGRLATGGRLAAVDRYDAEQNVRRAEDELLAVMDRRAPAR